MQWTKVSERLPETEDAGWERLSKYVLIASGPDIRIGCLSISDNGAQSWEDARGWSQQPTHWMPLPPPPDPCA